MRARMIGQDDGRRSFVVVLATGEEVMETLAGFVAGRAIRSASLSAIGAFSGAQLGYFDWGTKTYVAIPVAEQVEVASLTGDVATGPDGKPALHVHAVLGRRDGSAVAGHLRHGHVRPTLEVVLEELPARLRKVYDPASGLALIDPEA
jgi:predicted DNA-binding protein with PD1-like motif